MAYTPPEEYKKYDKYDAYEIPRSEFVDDFLNKHLEYMMDGGAMGLPISALDKFPQGNKLIVLVDMVRPLIKGKVLYLRLIYKLHPIVKEMFEFGAIAWDETAKAWRVGVKTKEV